MQLAQPGPAFRLRKVIIVWVALLKEVAVLFRMVLLVSSLKGKECSLSQRMNHPLLLARIRPLALDAYFP
jgi:hypothetical protein